MMTEEQNDAAVEETAASTLYPEKRILDKALYETVNNMLSSADKENHIIAEEILCNIDIDKSIYYMWCICRNNWWRFNRRRKRVREMITQNDEITVLVGKNTYGFATYLVTKKKMTKEIWELLKNDIDATLKVTCRNPFYDVEFKLKDIYADKDS